MSKIDIVLLGLLSEQERHGYDILQQIERREMRQWVGVSTQGIYKGLTRLEAKGLLEARVESGESHPDRNVYRITPAGAAHFGELAGRAISEPVKPHFPLLWGIGFGHLVDREELLKGLDKRREQLKPIRELLDALRIKHKEAKHPITADAIIEYYMELIEMELTWMTRLQRRLKRMKQWPEGGLEC